MTSPDIGAALSPSRMPACCPAPSLRRRMACWMYEGMLMFGVVFIAGYLFSATTQTRHALENRHGMQAFLFAVSALYFVWFWSRGQTLAMKTWHIRVVDKHGQALRGGRALLRYVLCWVWFLPPLAAMAPWALRGTEVAVLLMGWVAVWALLSRFNREQQFWHDIWAGTRLIDVQPQQQRRRA